MKYSFNSQGTETNTGAQSIFLVWRIMYNTEGSTTNSVSVIINNEDKDNDNDASDSKEWTRHVGGVRDVNQCNGCRTVRLIAASTSQLCSCWSCVASSSAVRYTWAGRRRITRYPPSNRSAEKWRAILSKRWPRSKFWLSFTFDTECLITFQIWWLRLPSRSSWSQRRSQ